MISIVNGYVCTSSCEAASAKQGKDPSAPPGTLPGASKPGKASGYAGQPAAILDGALKGLASTNAVDASAGSRPSVNLLV